MSAASEWSNASVFADSARESAIAMSDVTTGDPVLAWAGPVTTVGRRALRFARARPPAG